MDSVLNSFLNQKETYSLPCPKYWRICTYCVVPENIHTPPPTEEIGFSRGGGRGDGHHRQIFPEGSRDAQESNKEKTQKLTTTIYLRRYKTRKKSKSYYTYRLMNIANIILSVPWRDLSRENVSYS